MSSDVFDGTGHAASTHYEPVPERDTFVTSAYLATAHKHDALEAVVTIDGKPVDEVGEVLHVGMVPIERRWAIGPATDGIAEAMKQDDFNREYKMWYAHSYAFLGREPDDVSKAPIPTVRNWLAWKVDSHDRRKLLPLGMLGPNETPKFDPKVDGAHTYDPTKDRFVEDSIEESRVAANDRLAEMEAEQKEKDARIEELEKRLAASAPQVDAPTASVSEYEVAPCGKPDVKRGYLKQHARHCTTCQELADGG